MDRQDTLLAHPVRAAIHGYVAHHPGSRLAEVGKAVGIGWGTLVHHVTVLERARLITEVREGRARRLFPEDETHAADRRKQAIASAVTAAAILAILRDDPGLDQTELARRLGRSRRALREQLGRLMASGIVEARREGRTLRYRSAWPD